MIHVHASIPRFAPVAALAAMVAGLATAQPENLGEIDTSDGVRRTVAVWAVPGLTRSPVSFTIGPDGRLYVAESDRAGNAVTDTRQLGHLDAVWGDGQLRTVEDRRALIDRWVAGGHFDADFFTRTEDRVRVVSDTDGDGTADTASVFAGGFDDAVDGIASGVLWSGDTLLFTNIPHLWALRDADGDGSIDDDPSERTPIASGFGVRWCFYGHDLHGLAEGPDGRIWFTVGDRGYNVTTADGTRYVGPDRGAAFRCWPDGSGLELVHEGLRNPQELVFDVLGNPFTGDNNCDSGDRARVTLVVDGGDSGWRQDVQSLPSRGPWNREGMWHLAEADADLADPSRPAWVLPPIAHVGAGPSGFTLQPGTGESGAYDGALMMVDFYGSGATVHAMRMEPRGAWFRLGERRTYYRGATVTDIEWGADGRLYMTDWGGGWSPNPNGRVLVVTNEDVHGSADGRAAIASARAWLDGAPAERDVAALVDGLDHRDRRVRRRVQTELARRGGWRPTAPVAGERSVADPALVELLADRIGAAAADGIDLGAVHATWALGQIAIRDPDARARLASAAAHASPVIRTEAFEILGDLDDPDVAALAEAAFGDADPSVRAAAIRAFGRSRALRGVDPANLDRLMAAVDAPVLRDPVLRLAMVVAAARTVPTPDLVAAMETADADRRLLLALALRRHATIRVGEDVPIAGPRAERRSLVGAALADRLDDPDLRVAAEAARAIYDLHLGAPEPFSPPPGGRGPEAGGPAGPVDPAASDPDAPFRRLARSLDGITTPGRAIEPVVRRALEANLRLGGSDPAGADRLVRFAARDSVPAEWRQLAIERLEAWGSADRRERVWGHWIPRPARDVAPVRAAVLAHQSELVAAAEGDAELTFAVNRLRVRLLEQGTPDEITVTLTDAGRDPRYRAVLLEESARRHPAHAAAFCDAVFALEGDEHDVVRMAGLDVLAADQAARRRCTEVVERALDRGTRRERQHAAKAIGDLMTQTGDPAAAEWAKATVTGLLTSGAGPGEANGSAAAAADDVRLELYRIAAAAPKGSPLVAVAEALDAPWSGRRPAGFGDALLASGGDPARGESIFLHHEAAQCLRCHTIDRTDGYGTIGGVAGPRLIGVGARLTRAALVESLVEPAATITPGYGTVAAMPIITDMLSPEEVRDVVAYLAAMDDLPPVRPEGRQIRASRFMAGTAWHLVAIVGGVILAGVLAGRRG